MTVPDSKIRAILKLGMKKTTLQIFFFLILLNWLNSQSSLQQLILGMQNDVTLHVRTIIIKPISRYML